MSPLRLTQAASLVAERWGPSLTELAMAGAGPNRDAGVTDVGLAALARCSALRSLDLSGSSVTTDGIRRFLASGPQGLESIKLELCRGLSRCDSSLRGHPPAPCAVCRCNGWCNMQSLATQRLLNHGILWTHRFCLACSDLDTLLFPLSACIALYQVGSNRSSVIRWLGAAPSGPGR